jgi:hypothetical protein
MLYQLSYSRGVTWYYEITPKNRISNRACTMPYERSTMANRPLSPVSRRVVGLLLILSGALLGLGLLIKVAVGVYNWNTLGSQNPSALLLSANLVALLASGLLMRWGLRIRRGDDGHRDPTADEIL